MKRRRRSCRGGGTADGEPSAASGKENDDGMGPEANLRIQKAKLAVTLEELERLKQLLAKKSEQMATTEQEVRELQQKTSLLSRSEKSLQNALEKERMVNAEGTKKAEALERELGLLKKDSGDAKCKIPKLHVMESNNNEVSSSSLLSSCCFVLKRIARRNALQKYSKSSVFSCLSIFSRVFSSLVLATCSNTCDCFKGNRSRKSRRSFVAIAAVR